MDDVYQCPNCGGFTDIEGDECILCLPYGESCDYKSCTPAQKQLIRDYQLALAKQRAQVEAQRA